MHFCPAQNRGTVVTNENEGTITRNLALVVGISSYPHLGRLLYADDDANLFADYLINEKICDKKDVTLLIDSVATKANFFKELRKLLDKSTASDRIFIYFAGHGDVENDIESGFLLTYHCEPTNYPATDAIDISMLEKFVGAFTKKNTKVVLITDACRSGNLAGGMSGAKSTISSLNNGFQNVIKILSCQPNQLSQEKYYPGGGHGVFTYHLIDGLSGLADKDNDKYITLRELDRYLDEVAEETNQQQVPKTDGDPTIRIAGFSEELKLALLAKKKNNNAVASATKTRGSIDSNWVSNKYFQAFNDHIRQNRLTNPQQNNAYSTILEAKKAKQDKEMVVDMELELAAVLEDQAQQFINKYLRGDLPTDQKECIRQLETAGNYIHTIETIIGKDDFRYNEIHVKKLFFDAYTIFKKTQTHRFKEAATYLEMANKLSGNQAWILNALGLFYEDLKQKDRAEQTYREAIKLAPKWSYPWNNLGVLYWKQDLLKKAEEAYRRSIELDSSYGFAWNGYGNVLDDLDRNDEAIEAYKKSINFNPYDADPWNGLGNVYREMGRNDEAENAYLTALTKDSSHIFAMNGLGNLYLDRENYSNAEKYYRRILKIDSSYSYAWNNLGLVHESRYQLNEAEYFYLMAIQTDSTDVTPVGNLGNVYRALKKPKEAADMYLKAISLAPRNAEYWNGLGLAYWDQNLIDKSINAYKEGLANDSKYQFLWYNLGRAYMLNEDYVQAAECFKKVLAIKPRQRSAWDLLFKALEATGNKEELERWKKKEAEVYPGGN